MSRPQFVLALDQGTTSSRALLFDSAGAVAASAQREFRQIFPQPGWVEHDPEEIWRTQIEAARAALRDVGATPRDVAAMGITNQRETTIVWERRTGNPLYNAIVWQDRRTAAAIEQLKVAGHEPLIRDRTGLVADAYFSASKIAWILDNVDGARQRAEAGELAFGTVDSWLVFRLTGGRRHVTDPSNASRTMLYDLRRQRWDRELLDLFDVPTEVLPEVVATSGVVADATTPSALRGVPIAGIVGDQQAALAGQSCWERGTAKNTYGTGCFLLLNTGPEVITSKHRLLSTIGWRIDGSVTYALEGSVFAGGATIQWLRDGLGIIDSAGEVEGLARSVPDAGGVYLVPAFTGLGAPHWDPFARGIVCGITRGTNAGHLARAALEGIAFQVADLVDAMAADTGVEIAELRVDGGAAANDLLLQTQADLLQIPIVRPHSVESTARGAAHMAAIAVGFWQLSAAAEDHRDVHFQPRLDPALAAARRGRWGDAVQRARGWADDSSQTRDA